MNLETRFFYRLVKVFYIFNLAFLVIIATTILFGAIPAGDIPDNENSYITCRDGKKYSLPVVGIQTNYDENKLHTNNRDIAMQFCYDPKLHGVTHNPFIKFIPENKLYSFTMVYKPRDWAYYFNTLIWCSLIAAIYYIVINIIKETLIYLAFGRKFTWGWLLIFSKKKTGEVK